jgi:four helix bundle protein
MKQSILRDKSFAFALQIVRLSQELQQNQKEFVLSKQILRSGTAIGALVREGEFAQSKSDFINKLSIALKEANETEYWILLLQEAKLIKDEVADSLQSDCKELIAMLVASVKTAKKVKSEQ